MAKIYKLSDRIEIAIGDVVVKIAPLSLSQKNEVQGMILEGQKTQTFQKVNDAVLLALKYCLKHIKGVQNSDDSDYELQFDSGILTDDCINDLMNMEHGQKLLSVCATFVGGIPNKFDIEGVSLVEKK